MNTTVEPKPIPYDVLKKFETLFNQRKYKEKPKYHDLEQMLAIRASSTPVKNKFTRLQCIPKNIYSIHKEADSSLFYFVRHNNNSKITPTGKFVFIIAVNNPGTLVCTEWMPSGWVGHTSLAKNVYNSDSPDWLSKKYILDRVRTTNLGGIVKKNPLGMTYVEDVYFAGEIFFNDGCLVMWNNMSGHYRARPFLSLYNIMPHLRNVLPLDKYIGEFWQNPVNCST